MKFPAVLVIVISLLTLAHSQPGDIPPESASIPTELSEQLQIKSTRVVAFSRSTLLKSKCDAAGNVYIYLIDSETIKQYGRYSKSPISRIKPNGNLAGTFKISNISPDLSGKDFFVTRHGRLFLAARSDTDLTVYVIAFDDNGLFRSKIKIEAAPFLPYQIVAFPTGEFLLSGTRGRNNHIPFTAVFGPSGKLIREIYEPEDEHSRQRAEARDRDFVSRNTISGNTSVWHGSSALGSDGNAYLLRATSPALVYVISPAGEVLRKLRIESPSGLRAKYVLQSAGNRLAIGFVADGSMAGIIKVVDLQGNPLGQYISDHKETYPGYLSCYRPLSFTFVSGDCEDVVRLYQAGAVQ